MFAELNHYDPEISFGFHQHMGKKGKGISKLTSIV
jgi:hypothetical protein